MITIANLYPKELNLYGENGNIKALAYALKQKKIKYKIINIDKENKLEFNKYDFIYLGSGRKAYLDIVKERLKPYKEDILNAIKKEKVFLVTGNALSILEFLDLYEINYYEERKVSDVTATCTLCNELIKGFQNTEYLIKTTSNLIFNIEQGYGNNDTLMEGYTYHNLYVTSLIGPLLARNEKLTNFFVELLTK